MTRSTAIAWLAGLTLASLVCARAQADTVVEIGRPLQLKSADYGAQDVTQLTADLKSVIDRALAHSRAPEKPVRIQLVLEDATPNRPTITELGRRPSLSPRSIGLGGAWVVGKAVFADGRTTPISFSFYETNLRNELGPGVWSDADRAFDMLASSLAQGKIPNESNPRVDTQASFSRLSG